MQGKTKVLSIAGFDPSAGAGIISDVKTFEAHGVYGLSVCSAITAQNENHFYDVNWLSLADIKNQLEPLIGHYSFEIIKIGLIQDLSLLSDLIDYLSNRIPNSKIIWDPIISSSSGFVFHENSSAELLKKICKKIYLLTPNLNEIAFFIPGEETLNACTQLSKHCALLLKGGHQLSKKSTDKLYEKGIEIASFTSTRKAYDKHGTGCVLSASIAANLAIGKSLTNSCELAKSYIDNFLTSSTTKIGYHSYGVIA
jgi:hydroxymethylpyrimidine/phosphomethylpyrimidine kinase